MVSYRNGFINNHYMKDFHELLRLRRSTRKFTEQEIASDDVKTIMEAALMAPSSKRSLSWEFVLVEDELGLGSCWVQVRGRYGENGESAEDFVRELLNIPLPMQVLAIIALGHKAETKTPFDPEKAAWEKVHIGQW